MQSLANTEVSVIISPDRDQPQAQPCHANTEVPIPKRFEGAHLNPQTMTGNQLSPAMQSLEITEVTVLVPQNMTSPKLSPAMQSLAITEVDGLISPGHDRSLHAVAIFH